jgi:gamma-glutamyl hercynylcysteine S-oxide synthase
MKWYIGLILGLSLVCGATVSQGGWRMQIHHRWGTVEERALGDVDSLTFREVSDPQGMIWIPPGYVRLGQVGVAEPVNDVYVEGFWIDRYEVSNGKYKAFIDAGGYTISTYWNPAGWAWRVAADRTLPGGWNDPGSQGGGIPGNEQFPVHGVNWFEADAYCRWAAVRLPTEAEWEKAAKGGCETHGDPGRCDDADTPTYPWGEGLSGARANYYESGDPYETGLTPVGYFDGTCHPYPDPQPTCYETMDSPSPYGLYDVVGNIFEYTSTAYAPYPYNPTDGRESPPTSSDECCRVTRGGEQGYWAGYLRCASRIGDYVAYTNIGTSRGFRCAMSP